MDRQCTVGGWKRRSAGTVLVLMLVGACASSDLVDPAERTASVSQRALTALGTFTTGSTVTIQYSAMGEGAPSATDWIGLFRSNETNDENVYNKRWAYTGGNASGSVAFTNMPPGSYVARAYYNWPAGGYARRQESSVFTISDGAASPVLSANAPGPNATITVTYSGLPGHDTDWIAIEANDGTAGPWPRWAFTNGQTSGVLTFPGLPQGDYVARAYYDYAGTGSTEIRATAPVTIGSAGDTALVTPSPYTGAGEAIDSVFAGFPGFAGDWIAIAAAGSADNAFLRWTYTGGVVSGLVTVPGLPEGDYEARGFFNWPSGAYTVQARQPFSVGSPPTFPAGLPIEYANFDSNGAHSAEAVQLETPVLSHDGRFVAFSSTSALVVANDTNGRRDIFVRDRQAGTNTRVSVGSGGIQANGDSSLVEISGNGRFVAFASGADNLVTGDTNSARDIFLHDRLTSQTTRVSQGMSGEANASSNVPVLSYDGRYVAFLSSASNLVPGDTNGVDDCFRYDRVAGTIVRANVSSSSAQIANVNSCVLSGNGRYVLFGSNDASVVGGDTNGLADVFLRDMTAGTTTRVGLTNAGQEIAGGAGGSSVSADGRYVLFGTAASNVVTGDTNGVSDVFLRDLQASTTTRVSVSSTGAQLTGASGAAKLSADGTHLYFLTDAPDVVTSPPTISVPQIYARAVVGGTTRMVSKSEANTASLGGVFSGLASISGNGAYVAFVSHATGLIWDDVDSPDVFVAPVHSAPSFPKGQPIELATVHSDESHVHTGESATQETPAISSDGRYVAFASTRNVLVASDTNGFKDVFVRDRLAGTTTRVSVGPGGVEGNGDSGAVSISGDGRFVAFTSVAANLVASDTNAVQDAFVFDRKTSVTTRVSLGIAGESNGASTTAILSDDGRYVGILSAASNLVTGDTNGVVDCFRHDRLTGATVRASVSSSSAQIANVQQCVLSGGGQYAVFTSSSTNVVPSDTNGAIDVFLRDIAAGTTTRVSLTDADAQIPGASTNPSISANGRYVLFSTPSPAVVTGDTNGVADVFLRDIPGLTTTRVSVRSTGAQLGVASTIGKLNSDGTYLVFMSSATNVVTSPTTTAVSQAYVRAVPAGTISMVSKSASNVAASTGVFPATVSISGDGSYVTFQSQASFLVVNDNIHSFDVFAAPVP